MKSAHFFCSLVTFLLAAGTFPVAVRPADSSPEAIKLPQPLLTGPASVEQALHDRRSVRNYRDAPITLRDLSQLLWAAQGISGQGRRTAPSAGALYPLEVCVVAGRVAGLSAGVYAYRPEGHELLMVAGGDKRADLSRASLGQPAVRNAPAVLVISGVYERTMVKYGERGIRYVHMEAGHAAENVYLQAVSLGLGTVVIGAFDDEEVKKSANLTVREQPLYLMPVGKGEGERP